MSCEWRAHLHQQAGTALARAYGGAADQHAAELAHHFWHSGDRTRALRYAVRAAQDATTQMAHEEAARHYGVALAALEREPAR